MYPTNTINPMEMTKSVTKPKQGLGVVSKEKREPAILNLDDVVSMVSTIIMDGFRDGVYTLITDINGKEGVCDETLETIMEKFKIKTQ